MLLVLLGFELLLAVGEELVVLKGGEEGFLVLGLLLATGFLLEHLGVQVLFVGLELLGGELGLPFSP